MIFTKNAFTNLLFLTAALLPGCGLVDGDDNSVNGSNRIAKAEFSHEYTAQYRTQIRIEAINGTISMTGSPGRNSIAVSGVRSVGSESTEDAKEILQHLEVRVTEFAGAILVETIQPKDTGGRTFAVDYMIRLPDHLSGYVSQNNGSVTIEEMQDNLEIELVNGDARLKNITAGSAVSVVNGTIKSKMVLPPGGTLDHSVVNGRIELAIPDTTSAEFSAQVVNGDIQLTGLDLGDPIISEKSITGNLGQGDGIINLQVVNGQILVAGRN